MKKVNVFFLFILCALSVSAQQSPNRIYFSDSSLINNSKVYAYGNEKTLAWSGGVNSPNFVTADVNNDGKQDLVIYEEYKNPASRFVNGIRTFINRGTSSVPRYVYEPKYQENFPAPEQFIKMFDYNCDNVPDILMGLGLQLYKGYYNNRNELCFTFVKEIMYFDPSVNGEIYLNIGPEEIPSIEDVDFDGDLDIVALGSSGNSSLYKNMRVELSLSCDSLFFRLKDNCWGRVFQDVQREHILHHYCDNSGLKTTHGANTCTLFDHDGDNDLDVLVGNFSYSDLQYLHNGRVETGSPVDSIISQDTTWQSNGRMLIMPQFPAAFWVDIDQNGLRDVLVAPHGKDVGENYKCVAYYKNTGTPGNYQYTYQSDTFLVDQMIDLGTAAYPALYDYDKDGKPDLFVGSDGYFQTVMTPFKSRLTYYKNTSTPGNISFELVNNNFLALNNIQGAAPAMGDIDNDGKDDLVIGNSDGNLMYYKNVAASGSVQPVWQLTQTILKDASMNNINVGYFAAPFIYDIDKDGKNDLIIGCQGGTLHYYKNVTTNNGTVMLQKITENLGNAKADPKSFTNGFSTPFIGKIDDSGTDYIMLGSNTGALYRYDGFQNGNTSTPYVMRDSVYSQVRIGNRTAPTIANIDGDAQGRMEMIVGNILGGLNIFQQRNNVGIPAVAGNKYQLDIYPNPAKNELLMHLNSVANKCTASVAVYNSVGQVVSNNEISVNNNTISIDVSTYAPGVYLCYVRHGQTVYTGKFTKE